MDMADEHDADYRSWEEAVHREAVISDLVGGRSSEKPGVDRIDACFHPRQFLRLGRSCPRKFLKRRAGIAADDAN
jgi:hypothetical protein